MLWVGWDRHKRSITACVVDDDGRVVADHRRLPADAPALLAAPGPFARAVRPRHTSAP